MSHTSTMTAAGRTDPGRQREVNEDRFHVDTARGLFAVIDGVGGQAAGGKAADVALAMLRSRLERETGPVEERIREAITIANNEIYRLASGRSEWAGMACVLTVALVQNGHATIGHVGDTRLYKLKHGRIEKITRDHSPVGEREDAHELSESEAMRHPRRNEVYRDVGSEPHQPADPEFVDVRLLPFEPDAALLLCSDGLSDLVPSVTIGQIVLERAGDPQAVVQALVDAANNAGGKDNVTVVYVEGARFAAERPGAAKHTTLPKRQPRVRVAFAVALLVVLGILLVPSRVGLPLADSIPLNAPQQRTASVVRPSESIAEAIARARPGSQVIVEPGEYREQLHLKDYVRVVSRVPRGATIRLPASASDADPAVLADGLAAAELAGFRIVGDAATPLGVGLVVRDSALSIVDVEITGATKVAIAFSGQPAAGLVGSEIHDNPGAALSVTSGASPRISHNTFIRNGTSLDAPSTLLIERGAAPRLQRNVFHGLSPDAFREWDDPARVALTRDNWFIGIPRLRGSAAPAGRTRQTR